MQIKEMKDKIHGLSDTEAKSILFQIYLGMNLIAEREYSDIEFVRDLEKVYGAIADISYAHSEIKEVEDVQMVHILFGASAAGILKVALKKMGIYEEESCLETRNLG